MNRKEPPRTWTVGTLAYTGAGLAILFGWLLWGDFAWSMRERTVPAAIQLLFKRYGASDTVLGILTTSLPAALGLILGPVIGYKSDRLRSRWGRRIPFLLFSTPVIVASVVGLAFAPQIGGFAHRFIGARIGPDLTVLLFLGLFWTMFELACTVANAVFGALLNDIVPHAVIGRFFGLFRAFSLVAGMIVNYWVMGKVETHFSWIFLGVAALYGFGFTLMCLKIREGAYPPPPVSDGEKAIGRLVAIRTYFRESFRNPYYLLLFTTTILWTLSLAPFNIYSILYARSLGMEMGVYFRCLAATYAISLCLAYPLGVLVDRFHPLRVSLCVMPLYVLIMAYGIFYVKDAASFSIVLVAHGVLAGTYLTASASLGQRLFPRSKFAELASAGGILSGLAWIALAPALGAILDRDGHAYHDVFYFASAFAAAGVVLGVIVYRRFLALGGPDNYQAPE